MSEELKLLRVEKKPSLGELKETLAAIDPSEGMSFEELEKEGIIEVYRDHLLKHDYRLAEKAFKTLVKAGLGQQLSTEEQNVYNKIQRLKKRAEWIIAFTFDEDTRNVLKKQDILKEIDVTGLSKKNIHEILDSFSAKLSDPTSCTTRVTKDDVERTMLYFVPGGRKKVLYELLREKNLA